ncbi:hypothetical protein PUN28_016782 [Cardiocondyla obscurior]|uniref:Uncharacterized protein n=1 Tax=Cardiocondyla obscurior TaxID=286306 RepID=A0AAW2EUK8_9HYME
MTRLRDDGGDLSRGAAESILDFCQPRTPVTAAVPMHSSPEIVRSLPSSTEINYRNRARGPPAVIVISLTLSESVREREGRDFLSFSNNCSCCRRTFVLEVALKVLIRVAQLFRCYKNIKVATLMREELNSGISFSKHIT